jgi:hypothetical protein
MVAAAGQRAAATRTHSILATAGVIALLVLSASLSLPRKSLSRIDLRKPPDVLIDRVHSVLETLGYGAPSTHSYWEFGGDDDLFREILGHPETLGGLDVATFRPGPLRFWWRSSPREMQPADELGAMTMDDPPWDVSGMMLVGVDPQGRLLRFSALQPQVDDRPPVATPPDYSQLFKLADLTGTAVSGTARGIGAAASAAGSTFDAVAAPTKFIVGKLFGDSEASGGKIADG